MRIVILRMTIRKEKSRNRKNANSLPPSRPLCRDSATPFRGEEANADTKESVIVKVRYESGKRYSVPSIDCLRRGHVLLSLVKHELVTSAVAAIDLFSCGHRNVSCRRQILYSGRRSKTDLSRLFCRYISNKLGWNSSTVYHSVRKMK